VLGDEVIPMLNAMSQGRSGSMATVHADSSAAVFRRLAAYAVQAPERLPIEATNLLIAGAIHFVVHVDVEETCYSRPGVEGGPGVGDMPWENAARRGPQVGVFRRVTSVREIVDADGPYIVSNELFRLSPTGEVQRAAPLRDQTASVLALHGYEQASWGQEGVARW
ncbi:MAG: hypothetical protein ACRDZ6_09680, partial [Acidimicrobiales bacterium]